MSGVLNLEEETMNHKNTFGEGYNSVAVFLSMQLEQKVKQVDNATKLYFQSLIVLGAGIATIVTALVTLKGWEKQMLAVFTFGIPAFLISWFGCFLFIYWEHHMLRINLDYTEKKAAEALKIPDDEVYLYHEDYLGVFNQAILPFTKIKSVQAVFIIIAAPSVATIFLAVIEAKDYFENTLYNIKYWYYYIAVIFIIAVILVGTHVQCVLRERKLKKKLGIIHKNIYEKNKKNDEKKDPV